MAELSDQLRGKVGASDLVQDTIVRALEKASTFRGESSVRHWLRRIMHNLAIDQATSVAEVLAIAQRAGFPAQNMVAGDVATVATNGERHVGPAERGGDVVENVIGIGSHQDVHVTDPTGWHPRTLNR